MDSNYRPERRQFSRVKFEAEAIIKQQGNEFSVELIDISLNGVLTAIPSDYQIRTDMPCVIQISLGDDPDSRILMQVTLVHMSSSFLGFQCTNIDMDSIIHLRRLIEMNLQEAGASERVLSELLKRYKLP